MPLFNSNLRLRHLSTRAIALIALSALALAASAQQTLYVSDEVYVPLRTGQGNSYRIRMNLKTGQPLTVMEISEDTQWARVMTEGGTEGWTQTQFLSKTLPAQQQLDAALQKNRKLEEQLAQLKQQSRELETQNRDLSKNVSSESQSRESLTQELEKIKQVSANAIALDRQNQELIAQNTKLASEKEKLTRENNQLNDDQRLDYMIYSAGLILLGILLAIVVPALKPKKKHSEWR